MTRDENTTQVVKTKQRLHLRILTKNNIKGLLVSFFITLTIESIHTFSLCIWFSYMVANSKEFQRVTSIAEKVTHNQLPTLKDRYGS